MASSRADLAAGSSEGWSKVCPPGGAGSTLRGAASPDCCVVTDCWCPIAGGFLAPDWMVSVVNRPDSGLFPLAGRENHPIAGGFFIRFRHSPQGAGDNSVRCGRTTYSVDSPRPPDGNRPITSRPSFTSAASAVAIVLRPSSVQSDSAPCPGQAQPQSSQACHARAISTAFDAGLPACVARACSRVRNPTARSVPALVVGRCGDHRIGPDGSGRGRRGTVQGPS